jgi:hypothetical protein
MKKNLLYFSLSMALLAMISGCKKDEPEIIDKALDGAHVGAVIKSNVLDYDNTTLTAEITLLVVDERGNFVSGLSKEDFSVVETYYFDEPKVTDIKKQGMPNAGPYSASLLLDQSGSILDTDPNDLRIEAAKIFIRFLGENDEVSLTSFQRRNYDILHDFTSDSLALFPLLDQLANTEGGSTPLYYTANEMISYTMENAKNKNKCIIAFTDGKDTGFSPNLLDVIDKAKQNDMEVFTIGLSNDIEFASMGYLANETNGAFMWAQDVKQLVSIFGNVGDLLHGSAIVYKLTYSASTPSPLSSNFIYNNTIEVNMDDKTISIPFIINTGSSSLKSSTIKRNWDLNK